jgi:hypothetical protein
MWSDADVFAFTPEHKRLLASLSRETGRSMPSLIAQALHLLCERYGKPPLPELRSP